MGDKIYFIELIQYENSNRFLKDPGVYQIPKEIDFKCTNKPPFMESSLLLAMGNPFKKRLLQGKLQQKGFCLILNWECAGRMQRANKRVIIHAIAKLRKGRDH